jgi:glutamate 5-kinase
VGTGGAETKVSAARIAAESGAAVLITATPLVADALAGREVGTWFDAAPQRGAAQRGEAERHEAVGDSALA